MAKSIEQLIDEVIAVEGGYSNHPADRGGATRYGVTQAVAREHGYTGDMRQFPRGEAVCIYKKIYWQSPGFDKVASLAPALAAEMFDTGINMGVTIPARFLQRALNALNRNAQDFPDIGVDGKLGAQSLNALAAYMRVRGRMGEEVLVKAIDALQGERYMSLAESRPANEAFFYGWLANRIGQ